MPSIRGSFSEGGREDCSILNIMGSHPSSNCSFIFLCFGRVVDTQQSLTRSMKTWKSALGGGWGGWVGGCVSKFPVQNPLVGT